MIERLSGKVVVVTGAARGFGRALADAFAAEQMRLVLADVLEPELDAAVETLRSGGTEVIGVVTDVSDSAAVVGLRDRAFAEFGTVHVLCNNAGGGGSGALCEPIDVAAWERVFAIDLLSVVHGLNAFLPRMLEQGEGHVVNTASRSGLVPPPFLGIYASAKAGMIALSEALEAELTARELPVGVTVLTPGGIRTEALLSGLAAYPDDTIDPVLHEFFSTRVAAAVDPSDLAGLVVRAIRAGVLYVNSHRETLDWLQRRVDRMVADAERVGTVV